MFGIGFFELVVIAVVALIFIGPKKMPELARQFGRFFVQIRRMTNDVRSTIDNAIHDAEIELVKEEREKLKKLLSENQNKVQAEVSAIQSEIKANFPDHAEIHTSEPKKVSEPSENS